MGLKKEDLFQGDVPQTGLGDWYANLIRISRYKCVIFTNEMTLFSFIAFQAKKKEIQKLSDLFQGQLYISLRQEQLQDEVVFSIMQDYTEIKYAPAQNRSVLGSMNDLVNCYEGYLEGIADPTPQTILQCNHQLNRIPMKPIGYSYAVEKLHNALTFRYQP